MLFWRGKLSKLGIVIIYAIFFGVIFVLKKSSLTVTPTCIVIKELKENVETQSRSNSQQEIQFQPSNNMVLGIAKEFEKNSSFNHPLYPGIPLDMPLLNPQPGLSIGNIGLGAKIVVGIPTVKRNNISYVEQTLSSIFENTNNSSYIKVVVYIGESDEKFINKKMNDLSNKFSKELEENLLQVISPPNNYYPTDWNSNLHLQFDDTVDRVKWRSKQNLDQVFLMMYINNLSPEYYLMLEDDVIARKNYDSDILKFANQHEKKDWFFLSFCSLGAIGKLFRRRTLPSYASFIHTFWNRKPLDWLQNDYVAAELCSYDEKHEICIKKIKSHMLSHRPSLFQHMGKVSSLNGKKQLLSDKTFRKDSVNQNVHPNHPKILPKRKILL